MLRLYDDDGLGTASRGDDGPQKTVLTGLNQGWIQCWRRPAAFLRPGSTTVTLFSQGRDDALRIGSVGARLPETARRWVDQGLPIL